MKLRDLLRRNETKPSAPLAPPPSPAIVVPPCMTFTFLDDAGGELVWSPAAERGRILAAAAALAALVPAGSAIGLLFKSGPELVSTWFACVHAGLRPLIVQYPTRKQSRAYWFDSVTHTITTAGLAAIVADDYCAGLGLPDTLRIIRADALPAAGVAAPGPLLPEQFAILQLSSGTTGYRKAMEFTADALRRHALDYNQVLKLDPARDRIVSWLPLYHDMGYVACFVMPILLGIDVVMMDPVTWVGAPELLFEAIERHRGTVCYMPNFGFEVMARTPARTLASVRHWISCSEPVSATTAAKFCAHIGADPRSFSPCYAMAENLFAVSFGTGFETRVIDGADVVCCGRPIPGVALKIVEGEIWARSPTSLTHYLGGEELIDADGYYPTGDLGQLIDGELYVAGRKQDVLIQAGRKFMLSDIDLKLNEAFPEVRGRAACLALRDDRLGTETPLILIEAIDFFDRTDMPDIAARMIDLTGMDQMEVAYVPPRFLTKTSSGKINRRKTRADWLAVQAAKTRTGGARDAVAELRIAFQHVDWSRPIGEVLDSLSATIVKITLETTPVLFDPKQSLDELAASLRATAPADPGEAVDSIRIVSLADRRLLLHITDEHLAALSERLGCPVTLEHVCLPPAPVLLSDLVFHDWFQPRQDQEPFGNVDQALDRLKEASLILVDDMAQMKFLYASTYPVLSHNLERDPSADLLCFRWQNYTKQHHLLPVSYVAGNDIPLASINTALDQLGRYLDKPIFRVSSMPGFAPFCGGWEYALPIPIRNPKQQTADMLGTLADWIEARPNIGRPKLRQGPQLMISDLAHFCSVMARQPSVDAVVNQFASFYVGGQPASLPYLQKKLDAAGKPYVLIPSLSAEFIDTLPEQYECLIICGSWGDPPATLPTVAFQHINAGWRTRNLGQAASKLKFMSRLNETPPSATDWYCGVPLGVPETDREIWSKARQGDHGRFRSA